MTTLAAALNNSATELRVDAAVANPAPYYQIDDEVIRLLQASVTYNEPVTSPNRTTDNRMWHVARGDAETTPVSHLSGATLTPIYPQVGTPALDVGGGAAEEGTVVVTPPSEVDIGAALEATPNPPDASNPYATMLDVGFVVSQVDPSLIAPVDQGVIWKDISGGLGPTAVWRERNAISDGWQASVHIRAVATGADEVKAIMEALTEDADADARPTATASGDGGALAGPVATTNGVSAADAHSKATAAGDGDADAHPAAITNGAGSALAGPTATATDDGYADATSQATANTGTAAAGSQATRGAESAGMTAVVDGTSARMGFNGTTPIAKPVIPLTTPDVQDVIDVLVALGLVSQSD